ncbi:MAG: hypothetical protein IAF58_06110 [Leptolyngbya sp.]|nr:hypothetical protein [Candidatus Melainabacteria bacterium]
MKLPLLKLKQKGVLIVTLPVILALILTSALIFLLNETESQLRRETFAAKVSALSAQLHSYYFESVYAGMIYHATGSEKFQTTFDDVMSKIPQKERELSQFLSQDEEQRNLVSIAIEDGREATEVLKKIRERTSEESGGKINSRDFRRNGLKYARKLAEDYRAINDYCKKVELNAPEKSAHNRNLVLFLLIFFLIAMVFLSIALALYFTKNITGRLNVITDNASRMARSAQLHPPLPEEDEISDLDHMFHKMVNALDESMRKERALLENAVSVLASLDSDMKFVKVSSASEKVWKISAEHLVGTRIAALLTPECGEQTVKELKGLIGSTIEKTFDTQFLQERSEPIDGSLRRSSA